MEKAFETVLHRVDFAVVGGGLAGLCAAVSAARHGAKVALIQERPMLGGNASSEIRMQVGGARGSNVRETGLVEEIMMENQYRNRDKNWSVWDGILYEMAKNEENIELLLNCSVNGCTMDGSRILSVTGWQMTTQQFHTVEAKIFADCSGDSVLAPLTGAEYRFGREAECEFGESIGRSIEKGDRKTMGMSCLIEAREEDRPSEFIAPKWAYRFTADDLPHRIPNLANPHENYWYLEIGGDGDSIADTEKMRDELLKIAYGVWDFCKNDPSQKEKNKNWRLDWLGILPGKRESRRYVGDYILTQNDVEAEGRFEDIVAYGGWPMDDHDPGGFFHNREKPNVNWRAPSPYGVPYRCLYSKNIDNLMFAGRNISVTHWALSSTRVMATCAVLGQVAGTAAAIAVREGCSPRGVYEKHLMELRQTLMEDDCYLPFGAREIPRLTVEGMLVNAPVEMRNGLDRPVCGRDNGAVFDIGCEFGYDWAEAREMHMARIIFDSDLDRETLPSVKDYRIDDNMFANRHLNTPEFGVPATMTKSFTLTGIGADGSRTVLFETDCNRQRLVHIPICGAYTGIRLCVNGTWGAEKAHVFSFDVR